MAIGTSAADLMISVISLFVAKSTVGLGTIIGSEIFNHLIISAACIMNSKNSIKLDKYIFTREVFGYIITIAILCGCLNKATFKPEMFEECLRVQWYVGLILMVSYVVYALVVVYFKTICVKFFGARLDEEIDEKVEEIPTENPMMNDGREDSTTDRASSTQGSRTADHSVDRSISAIEVGNVSRSSVASKSKIGGSILIVHKEIHAESISAQITKGLDPLAEAETMSLKKYSITATKVSQSPNPSL